jgi:phosphoglycerate kinase
VDINVPMEGGRVTDTTRIDKIVPTVADILAKGGKPVLLAHFDRPKGKVVPEMSLRRCCPRWRRRWAEGRLRRGLHRPMPRQARCHAGPGDVCLAGEHALSSGRGKERPRPCAPRPRWATSICNDAFSAAHRAHASTEALARLLPPAPGG